jgi:hypothetical protein
MCPGLGQRECRSSAYALAGTGYQRDLIGQIQRHTVPPRDLRDIIGKPFRKSTCQHPSHRPWDWQPVWALRVPRLP